MAIFTSGGLGDSAILILSICYKLSCHFMPWAWLCIAHNFKEANNVRASTLALPLSALRMDSSSLRSPILSPKFLNSAVDG